MKSPILFSVFPFITIIFTTSLLTIIWTKTPSYMKKFKFYFFQNVLFAFMAELSFFLCPCIALHPIIKLEPIGLTKNFHYNIMLIFCGFIGCCYLATLDCIIAMVFERYFTLKFGMTNEKSSKIPLYIYCILIFIDFTTFIFIILSIFAKPINDIFRNFGQNDAEFYPVNYIKLTVLVISVCFRLILTFIGCILNMKVSQLLKSQQQQLSTQVQKSNDAFRRLIFIQFSGVFLLQCCPILMTIFVYYFIKEPSDIPNYGIIGLTAFGFYDVLFTAIFIKPYQKVIFYPMKKFIKTMVSRFC